MRIGNQQERGSAPTWAIRDMLKASGYRWRSASWRSWEKSFSAEGFCIETLSSEPWGSSADGIEVRVCDAAESVVAVFRVNAGKWFCVSDDLGVS